MTASSDVNDGGAVDFEGDIAFDFDGDVALVTGACGALGSDVVEAFREAGATVAASDVVDPDSDDSLLELDGETTFHKADFTDESAAESTIEEVIAQHGRLDHLLSIAGTWRGGDPVHQTDTSQFDMLFDVNLKTAFLAAKHALPHLQETNGSIVAVSARSGLEGGAGDALYRASKAGVRILIESIAAENRGTVRANCVLPSVLDTPMNREMMDPDPEWVDPRDVAAVMCFLCSSGASVTSGAAVPVYGEA